MADKKATLHIEGQAPIELPIMDGSIGPQVVDVRKLGANGYFTFDPGFLATASCESQITYIDGGKGVLLHRGFPIDQLANNADYLEVCYILLVGEALHEKNMRVSNKSLHATPWFTNKSRVSSTVSVAMLTQWRLCAVL